MNFRKIFKKIITVSAVVGVLATGSVITGYAGYVKVGNTIERNNGGGSGWKRRKEGDG